jgi:hypothetical protein
MQSSQERPLAERLLLAVVALLFLLQPLANAAGSCTLRAKLFGSSCCCAAGETHSAPKSCCEKRAPHEAPARKRCGCALSAPPLVPPAGPSERPSFFLGELARAQELPCAVQLAFDLAPAPPRAHAPPGGGTCFHACLGASLARALAFERSLRS